MGTSKRLSAAHDVPASSRRNRERLETHESQYPALAAEEIVSEFSRLKETLFQGIARVSEARITIQSAIPHLASIQALLSQRGSARKQVLKQAGVPHWSQFAEEYAQRSGYMVRQIRTLIREYRAHGHISGVVCQEMLKSLMQLIEQLGDRMPLPVLTQCRYTGEVLQGKIDRKMWNQHIQELQAALANNSVSDTAESNTPVQEEAGMQSEMQSNSKERSVYASSTLSSNDQEIPSAPAEKVATSDPPKRSARRTRSSIEPLTDTVADSLDQKASFDAGLDKAQDEQLDLLRWVDGETVTAEEAVA